MGIFLSFIRSMMDDETAWTPVRALSAAPSLLRKHPSSKSLPGTAQLNKHADPKSPATETLMPKKKTEPPTTLTKYYSSGRGRMILNKKYGLSDSESISLSSEALAQTPPKSQKVPHIPRANSESKASPALASTTSKSEPKATPSTSEASQSETKKEPLKIGSGLSKQARKEPDDDTDSNNNSRKFNCWNDIRASETWSDSSPPRNALNNRFQSLTISRSTKSASRSPFGTREDRRYGESRKSCSPWTRDSPEWRKSSPRAELTVADKPSEEMIEYTREKAKEWKNYHMNLVDTHCHFDMLFSKMRFYGDLSTYFDEFQELYMNNIESFINIACNPIRFSTQEKLTNYRRRMSHPKVYTVIGCHPHFCSNWTEEIGTLIFNNISHEDIIAIGECGLDISYKNQVDIELQKQVFKSQLKIARKTAKPVVIHARGAEDQVFEILKEHLKETHRIHLHCFCGGWTLAKKFLDAFPNLCIGVTPLITYSKYAEGSVYEMIENIPLDRLLLETDAPYFVPRIPDFPARTVDFSHPAFIYTTAESVAFVKDLSVNEVLDATRENVRKVYRI